MKTTIRKIAAVLMVAGLMAAGPAAYAEQAGEGPEPGGFKHRGGKEFMQELGLSAEQKQKLDEQREAKKEANKALREQLKAKMEALHEMIAKPGTKRADVDGLVNEVNGLKGQMFAQKIDGLFATKEVLTPEQFAKMESQRKEWQTKMRQMWQKKGKETKEQD